MGRHPIRKDPDLTVWEAQRARLFTPAFVSRLANGLEIAGLPKHKTSIALKSGSTTLRVSY
jgi:hypothetical protein